MTEDEIKALQDAKTAADAELVKLRGEHEELKKKVPAPKPKDGEGGGEDDDLEKKAERDRKAAEETKNKGKRVEQAIKFELGLGEFTKGNKGYLPADFEGILDRASKEKYDDAVAKGKAIKSSFISSFFKVKENYDSLTPPQKSQIDEFIGLTNTGREDRAEALYENIFEPALESLKKVKKAEQLNRARQGLSDGGSSVENDYKDRLIAQSKNAYLKKKGA